MTDHEFQSQVLSEFQKLHTRIGSLEVRFDTLEGRFDTLEGKVDSIATELHEFRESQAKHNLDTEDGIKSLWSLSNQSFAAINDIQREVVSPWKLRSHRNAA